MKIGILQCGRIPEELIGKHDDYDVQFQHLLGTTHFAYQTWAVLDNELPDTAAQADGWLITGSKFGVYEDHDWIPPLEKHIQDVYAAGLPMVGICFGHQIIAQALGGEVKKFDGGWSVGHVDYTMHPLDREQAGNLSGKSTLGLHAFHQDQIVRLPPDAQAYGSSSFCQYAFVRYRGAAISIQPHPEFTDVYLQDLLAVRGKVLPAGVASSGRESIGQALDSNVVANELTAFFLSYDSQQSADSAVSG